MVELHCSPWRGLGGRPTGACPHRVTLLYVDCSACHPYVFGRLQVKQSLLQSSTPLVGAMCWMLAAEGYYQDSYTLYPSSPELNVLSDMCREINNKPRPS